MNVIHAKFLKTRKHQQNEEHTSEPWLFHILYLAAWRYNLRRWNRVAYFDICFGSFLFCAQGMWRTYKNRSNIVRIVVHYRQIFNMKDEKRQKKKWFSIYAIRDRM